MDRPPDAAHIHFVGCTRPVRHRRRPAALRAVLRPGPGRAATRSAPPGRRRRCRTAQHRPWRCLAGPPDGWHPPRRRSDPRRRGSGAAAALPLAGVADRDLLEAHPVVARAARDVQVTVDAGEHLVPACASPRSRGAAPRRERLVPQRPRPGSRSSGQWLASTTGPSTAASRRSVAATRSRHHAATDGYGSACSRPSSAAVTPAGLRRRERRGLAARVEVVRRWRRRPRPSAPSGWNE